MTEDPSSTSLSPAEQLLKTVKFMVLKNTQSPTAATKGEKTRRRILDAVVDSIHEAGLASTTFARIIERSQTSQGQLQHYFASRNHLLAETARYALDQSLDLAILDFADHVKHLLEQGSDPIPAFLDRIWDATQMKWHHTQVEIGIASRTNHDLRSLTAPIYQEFFERVQMLNNLPMPAPIQQMAPDWRERGLVAAYATAGMAQSHFLLSDSRLKDQIYGALRQFVFPPSSTRHSPDEVL